MRDVLSLDIKILNARAESAASVTAETSGWLHHDVGGPVRARGMQNTNSFKMSSNMFALSSGSFTMSFNVADASR